jgi:predicted RNA polymerase sigma factor
MSEVYQQVLTLYYLGCRNTQEIAEFLGMSPSAIRQRLSRAREMLKEEMVAMMTQTFEQQKLSAGFTFRVVEMVKRIKIQPISTPRSLPYGLSLATGLLLTI